MLFFLGVFIVMFVLLCIFVIPDVWSYHDASGNAMSIFFCIFMSGVAALIALLIACAIVEYTAPTEKVVDKTAVILPVSLNGGEVALGYEAIPSTTGGKWYVYRDEQDDGTKYLFIEQTDDPVDFGIDVKLIDAKKCEIHYIDDEDACFAEYYHTEYTGGHEADHSKEKRRKLVDALCTQRFRRGYLVPVQQLRLQAISKRAHESGLFFIRLEKPDNSRIKIMATCSFPHPR